MIHNGLITKPGHQFLDSNADTGCDKMTFLYGFLISKMRTLILESKKIIKVPKRKLIYVYTQICLI